MDESSRTLQCVITLLMVYHFRAVNTKLQEVRMKGDSPELSENWGFELN